MYPPHHLGGYEVVCRDVVDRWRKRGHDVEVLTTTHKVPGADEQTTEPSVRIRRELGFYWSDHRILTPPLAARLRMERANHAALAAALAEHRPDVVSVWHMGAMSLGLLQTIADQGLPMVFVIGDDWLVYGPKVDAWTKLFIGRPRIGHVVRKLAGVPTVVTLDPESFTACFATDWLRRQAIERSPWKLGRAVVVPHGIDNGSFGHAGVERPWSWRILSLGRVEERKGIHVAIEALAHLPNEATLDISGPPHDRYVGRLTQLAARLGLSSRVRFRGTVPRSRLGDLYRAADVFVHPVVWDEPFGLTPLEAMACGTPVVATGTGGSAEFLIDGANCLLVPRGDSRTLADALQRLADDPALRRTLVDGGLTTAAQLDVDHMALGLEDWNRAAAEHFQHGEPAAARGISAVVEPSASEPDPDA